MKEFAVKKDGRAATRADGTGARYRGRSDQEPAAMTPARRKLTRAVQEQISVRFSDVELAAVDAWIQRRAPEARRVQAVRRLIGQAITALEEAEITIRNPSPPPPIVAEGSQGVAEFVLGMADCLYSICNALDAAGACRREVLAAAFKAALEQQGSDPATNTSARKYVARALFQLMADPPRAEAIRRLEQALAPAHRRKLK